MSLDITTAELDLAKKIAKQSASKWKGVLAEDAVSHLYVWLAEHHAVLVRYRNEENGVAKLALALKREANRYCVKEKTILNGGVLDYNFQYTKEQVKRTLPYIWDMGSVSQTTVYENENVRKQHFKETVFDDALAMIADISSVYYGLNKKDQEILALSYRDDLSYKNIGIALEITENNVKQKILVAINHLHSGLCGEQ